MMCSTKGEVIKGIAQWVKVRYNHIRLHLSLGYRASDKFESEFLGIKKGT